MLPLFWQTCSHVKNYLLSQYYVCPQGACDSWQEGVEALRQDMANNQLPRPDRVRDLLLSAAATGAALGHMDDLQVRHHIEGGGVLVGGGGRGADEQAQLQLAQG